MRYSREWLDLGEMEMGINRKLNQETSIHDYILIDTFDIIQDSTFRDDFFKRLLGQCVVQQK